jgi:hypothetical protein
LRPIKKKTSAKSRRKVLADLARIWKEFPQVDTDSGRFLEEDR